MPELPEVETMRRGVAAAVGCRIEHVERTRCRRRPILIAPRIDQLRRRIVGSTIVQAGRIGKRVTLELARGGQAAEILVFEPRMTGLVLLADPPTWEHLRLRITLSDTPGEVLYWDRRGLGSVRLLSRARLAQRFGAGVLGPDALTVTCEQLQVRLGASRRPIKVALLDQRAVAGIGNLYAAEILHVARLHPATPCNGLRPTDWVCLHAAVIEVLEEAIRYEGSTLADGTYRNALNQSGSYQHRHRVYDRAGGRCPSCRSATVERIVQAQRATFFCPVCQPRRPMRR
jgi:formamidopyrimidine-DNA glycosylase